MTDWKDHSCEDCEYQIKGLRASSTRLKMIYSRLRMRKLVMMTKIFPIIMILTVGGGI